MNYLVDYAWIVTQLLEHTNLSIKLKKNTLSYFILMLRMNTTLLYVTTNKP